MHSKENHQIKAQVTGGRLHALWNISDNWSALLTSSAEETTGEGVWDSDQYLSDYKVTRFEDESRRDDWQSASITLVRMPDIDKAHQAFKRGATFHEAGQLDEALHWYRKNLEIQPENAAALRNLGLVLQTQGKLDKAVATYQKAVTIKSDFAVAHFNLGNALIAQGKLDEALSSFQKAASIKADFAEAHCNLGNTLLDLGRLDEAVSSYQRAVSVNPDFADAHYNLGSALKEQGKLDEAVSSFQKAVSIRPDIAEAHSNLGSALRELGKLDEALSSFRKAVSIRPDIAEAHCNLGNTLLDLGKLDEAVSSYQEAVSIKPGFADAHYNLGNVLKEQGKLDEAVSSFQKVISIRPDMAQAHSSLGDALKEQGRLDAAVSSFRTAASIRPDIAEAHSNLGNALREQGNLDEAISSYEKAISIKPDFVGAQHILNSLLGKTTRQPPRKYVETLFDEFATNFDNHLLNKLEYSMPSLLKKALVDLGLGDESLKMVLDLGCGTGLAGAEFRDIAESLIGIDLSENMVREAEKKNIYDELHVNDIVDGLNSLESQFDLFIAADVFTYIGDLLELFNCVKQHSTKNALFVFSTEHENCDEYVLQTTGRYAHSKDYVLSVATETGFHLEYFVQANIRKENESWIAGGIYILRRGDTQIGH